MAKERKAKRIREGYQIWVPKLQEWVQVTGVITSHSYYGRQTRYGFRDNTGRIVLNQVPPNTRIQSRKPKEARKC